MYELRSMGGGSLWIGWREADGMLALCLSTSILLSIIAVDKNAVNCFYRVIVVKRKDSAFCLHKHSFDITDTTDS